ncbi:MAG: GOLPH3/VPS74 family protein [Candidatus Heimdallarchaeota archaeon]
MLLAEKYLVLLIDEETSEMKEPLFFRYAYTGALIIELLLQKKITLEKKRFKVEVQTPDPTPTGNKPLDYILNDICHSRNKSLRGLIRKYCNSPDYKIFELLVESMKNNGLLRDVIEKKHMRISKKMLYPLANPEIKMEIQEEIKEGITTEDKPTETALVLLSLMYVTWTTKKIIGKDDRKAAWKKGKKLFAKKDRSLIKEYSESLYYVAKEIKNQVIYAYA